MGTEPLIVEGKRAYVVVTPAEVIDEPEIEDRLVAWAAPHVVPRWDFGYVLGRFVQADVANENGHIFALDDLIASYRTVVNAPLNLLHRVHHTIGTFLATELLYPADARMPGTPETPWTETLAAVWRYAYPDEYNAIKRSYEMGAAALSMENVPEGVQCMTKGCEAEFNFAGTRADAYCDHLRQPKAPVRLVKPHFVGGGAIIPPARPGWRKADITEIAELVGGTEATEELYAEVASMFPDLSPAKWESVMADLVARAN